MRIIKIIKIIKIAIAAIIIGSIGNEVFVSGSCNVTVSVSSYCSSLSSGSTSVIVVSDSSAGSSDGSGVTVGFVIGSSDGLGVTVGLAAGFAVGAGVGFGVSTDSILLELLAGFAFTVNSQSAIYSSLDAVIHFAGYKAVGESVQKPLQYYRNNIDSTLTLIEVMEEHGCKKLVFSSSATVYGPNNPHPYKEDMPAIQSTNPYGWTKVMIERILTDYVAAHPDFCAILLRYFNPIGAHESGLLGDDPNGIPNNLMPYIGRVAAGQLESLTIHGGDYDTPDGSCQRDYLHVVDLALGHLKALEYADRHTGVEAVNLGTGNGVSVLELVKAFETANNMSLNYCIGPRRAGDLPAFWADASKAKGLLGWEASHTLEDMCKSSWNFARNNA